VNLRIEKTFYIFIFISLFPIFHYAQQYDEQINIKVNSGKTNIYCDAIKHYIDSVYRRDNSAHDTVFVLKNGEFPDNCIQSSIQKINIVSQDTATMVNRFQYHKVLTALNIAPNLNFGKDRIDIIIVPFLVSKTKEKINYVPLGNCNVVYNYNANSKEFEFQRIIWKEQNGK